MNKPLPRFILPEKKAKAYANLKPGQSPGRPLGSRNKLSEKFLQTIHDDFLKHGVAAIEKVREDNPGIYLRVIASLIPKELHIKDESLEDLPDNELFDLLAAVRSVATQARRAKAAKRTEPETGNSPAGEQLN